MNFADFVTSDYKNLWIEEENMFCYVRKAVRVLGPSFVPTIDVATIEVAEEMRGQGIFTSFLTRVEQTAKTQQRAVFVESVMAPRLANFLLKRGYILDPRNSTTLAPSFFKPLSKL